ncbi:MAG: hypothetical protein HeimC2_46040 [Candidatus Heimdallarchaeota archaeon LC_2]|nr:MAG: hypothetical protein HeimC2_46040 [Candidatus Heimdallarchaeota archaeon LC_2]
MLQIILYGNLKKLVTHSQSTQISTLEIQYKENETLEGCLARLGLRNDEVGEMFINHCLSYYTDVITRDNSRIAIFSKIMQLIDGGLYIRYCGYRSNIAN